jgi:lysophospholipase L1-like esterase
MAVGADATPSNNLLQLIRAPSAWPRAVLGWITGANRWRRIVVNLMLMVATAVASVLIGIVFTPEQPVDTLGQHFTIRAAAPSFSLTGRGEITVNTGRPQTFYLLPTEYYGPLRVHLSVDAPFQGSDLLNKAAVDHRLPPEVGDDFTRAFTAWLWRFVAVTLGAGVVIGGAIAFVILMIDNRRRPAVMLLVRFAAVSALNVGLVSALFVAGSSTIANATSLDGLVGHSTLHLSPKPEGPKVTGYDAVSIGDSRAATQGGKEIKDATKEDKDCQRSSDSLAAQIGHLKGWRVLNLACSSATINEGLMGQQSRGGRLLSPQISRVKQMTNLRAVFVTIGPNDLWWSRAIGLCYLSEVCNDNLTTPQYEALLEKFKWNYHDLLVELQGLRNGPDGSRPQIVINGSYDVVENGDTCAAIKGLAQEKIAMLNARNGDLNQALQTGAGLFGFVYVRPELKTLCADLSDVPGPEIRSPDEHDAFHPTALGVWVMATDDVLAMAGVSDSSAANPPK